MRAETALLIKILLQTQTEIASEFVGENLLRIQSADVEITDDEADLIETLLLDQD